MPSNLIKRTQEQITRDYHRRIEAAVDAEANGPPPPPAPPAGPTMSQSQFGGRPRTREEIARSGQQLADMIRRRGG